MDSLLVAMLFIHLYLHSATPVAANTIAPYTPHCCNSYIFFATSLTWCNIGLATTACNFSVICQKNAPSKKCNNNNSRHPIWMPHYQPHPYIYGFKMYKTHQHRHNPHASVCLKIRHRPTLKRYPRRERSLNEHPYKILLRHWYEIAFTNTC